MERAWAEPLNKGASGTSLDLYIFIDFMIRSAYTTINLVQIYVMGLGGRVKHRKCFAFWVAEESVCFSLKLAHCISWIH